MNLKTYCLRLDLLLSIICILFLLTGREAAFIAIDCEFTGLKDPKSLIPKPQGRKQTIQERYRDVITHKVHHLVLVI